jgi:hypothetical protein
MFGCDDSEHESSYAASESGGDRLRDRDRWALRLARTPSSIGRVVPGSSARGRPRRRDSPRRRPPASHRGRAGGIRHRSRTSCASSGVVKRPYEGVLTSCASSERLISLGRAATARPPAGGAGDPSGDEGRVAHRPRARRPAADGTWCYQRGDRCDDTCRQGDGEDPRRQHLRRTRRRDRAAAIVFAYDHGVVTPGVHAAVTADSLHPRSEHNSGPRTDAQLRCGGLASPGVWRAS